MGAAQPNSVIEAAIWSICASVWMRGLSGYGTSRSSGTYSNLSGFPVICGMACLLLSDVGVPVCPCPVPVSCPRAFVGILLGVFAIFLKTAKCLSPCCPRCCPSLSSYAFLPGTLLGDRLGTGGDIVPGFVPPAEILLCFLARA